MKNRQSAKNQTRMLLLALAVLGGALAMQALRHAAAENAAANAGDTGYSVGLDRPTKFPADI